MLIPLEFYYMNKAYNEDEEEKRKFELMKMRLQTFYLINIQLDRNNKIKKPEILMPFYFDETELKEVHIPDQAKWDLLQRIYGDKKALNN